MLEQRRRVEAKQILADGQHVDGRIGEELEEVPQVVKDDGSHHFEAQQLIVDEQLDEGEGDQWDEGALA